MCAKERVRQRERESVGAAACLQNIKCILHKVDSINFRIMWAWSAHTQKERAARTTLNRRFNISEMKMKRKPSKLTVPATAGDTITNTIKGHTASGEFAIIMLFSYTHTHTWNGK